MEISICLTVHNKGYLLKQVLDGIYKNTNGEFEIIICLDGCSDNSQEIVFKYIGETSSDPNRIIKTKVIYADNVFETTANNLCSKKATGEYLIFLQDDVVLKEFNWNNRLLSPLKMHDDILCISGNCSHDWELNPNSIDAKTDVIDNTRWCDLISHVNHANKSTIGRNEIGIRQSCNRAPFAIKYDDFVRLNRFDEAFAPQDMDDADLCFRGQKELGKQAACITIDFESNPNWGGTRNEKGETKQWLFEAHNKNTRLFISRHKEAILKRTIENRKIF